MMMTATPLLRAVRVTSYFSFCNFSLILVFSNLSLLPVIFQSLLSPLFTTQLYCTISAYLISFHLICSFILYYSALFFSSPLRSAPLLSYPLFLSSPLYFSSSPVVSFSSPVSAVFSYLFLLFDNNLSIDVQRPSLEVLMCVRRHHDAQKQKKRCYLQKKRRRKRERVKWNGDERKGEKEQGKKRGGREGEEQKEKWSQLGEMRGSVSAGNTGRR
jgi:hypothetical protein